MREKSKKAWEGVFRSMAPERVTDKPRETGLTVMLDRCQGMRAMTDVMEMVGDYVDQIKLSFGTSAFLDEDLLLRKIDLVTGYGVDIYPGGTLMEASVIQGVFPEYLANAKRLGFRMIEVSDGTIDLPRDQRNDIIQRTLDAGLSVVAEVGKKDKTVKIEPARLCEDVQADIDAGASRVVIEARESGMGIGIYDDKGYLKLDTLNAIRECLSIDEDRIIWEAPRVRQQAALINEFGTNVSLGNVKPRDVIGLEALRQGLRFETFKFHAEAARLGDAIGHE